MLVDLGQLAAGGRLDWLTAALVMAQDADPSLDVQAVRRKLDEFAAPLLGRELSSRSPEEQAYELGDHLFRRLGFRGNEEDYEDPKNSLFNHVIERRLGIPITLALVYVEIARRAGVEASGVGFPGHFLVRIADPQLTLGFDRSIFVDPFGGAILETPDLELLAEKATGSSDVPEHWLQAADVPKIAVRMLNNLRSAYRRRGDLRGQLVVLHRMTELQPGSAQLLRDRGLLQAKLGAPRAAVADLEGYLTAMPQASDVQDVQQLIDDLSERLHRAHPRDAAN
ncbi:MAG TPA: tetratricopeptide repeat protein [Polyangiaceae bacterium]|nr:tetratricopeptide repeat protein [Polyangiaceae bacterium]